jgi:hypothetical protein
MELSILVAKILALYYLAIGVGVLSGKVNVSKVIKSFEDSPGLTLISGFLMIITGALLVNAHNLWVKDWTVLITIVAWAILIKGILFTAAPQMLLSFKGLYKNMKPSWGVLVIAIGLLFGYFGFLT